MSAPGLPHDPLATKHREKTEALNRRRVSHSETSKKIAEDRNAFFDKLALLNAGALTFSVTFLGNLAEQHPHRIFVLHTAWAFLLAALGACLVRNLSHQHYLFSDQAAKRAEAEIAFINVDDEVISRRPIAYSDSSEPFDLKRELLINRENRDIWRKELTEEQPRAERHWRLVLIMEWAAGLSMFTGFLLLVIFAVLNS